MRLWERVANPLPFEKAREYTRALGLKSVKEWYEYCKTHTLPEGIPMAPDAAYKGDGWISWGDFLGTGKRRVAQTVSFEKATEYARSLGCKSVKELHDYWKIHGRPQGIPRHPETAYRSAGWNGWSDFLGYSRRPFEQTREFARSLGLNSTTDWEQYWKTHERPADIPAAPERVYKGEWNGWGDFLDTGRHGRRELMPFEDARRYTRALGLNSEGEHRAYWKTHKRPLGMPSNPDKAYKGDGWISWPDFLGTDTRTNFDWIPYEEAREFARSLGLRSAKEWWEYWKIHGRPQGIPMAPHIVYKRDGWISWSDFLGTGNRPVTAQMRHRLGGRRPSLRSRSMPSSPSR
jgi:hypothetical protein